jgi:hypothetical protein
LLAQVIEHLRHLIDGVNLSPRLPGHGASSLLLQSGDRGPHPPGRLLRAGYDAKRYRLPANQDPKCRSLASVELLAQGQGGSLIRR